MIARFRSDDTCDTSSLSPMGDFIFRPSLSIDEIQGGERKQGAKELISAI